jgi:hypothetical protein
MRDDGSSEESVIRAISLNRSVEAFWRTETKRRSEGSSLHLDIWAEATGFEPAISALTGLRVRPLHHASNEEERYHAAETRVNSMRDSLVLAGGERGPSLPHPRPAPQVLQLRTPRSMPQ